MNLNLLLKILFITVLIVANRFTTGFSAILKPAYFGLAGLFIYYLISEMKTLSLFSSDKFAISLLATNVFFLFITGIFNKVGIEVVLYGLFPYFYILIIYFLIRNRSAISNNRVIFFAENLIFINSVICLFQGIFLLFRKGEWQDFVTGIHPYGTANELGYVFLLGLLINLFYKRPHSKWKAIIYISSMFLMEAKGAILLLLIAMVAINFNEIKKIKDSLITIIIIISFGFGMFFLINKESQTVKFKTDIFRSYQYESSYQSTASSARIAHLFYVAKNYFNIYHLSPLIGSGVGTYESPAGNYFHSSKLLLKEQIFRNVTTNTPQVTHTQIASLLAEGGYLSLFFFEFGLIALIISYCKNKQKYSLALLSVFFMSQIFHYIFLTFLTFIVFWPALFTISEFERINSFNKNKNSSSMEPVKKG